MWHLKITAKCAICSRTNSGETLIIHGTIDGLVPIEKSRNLVKRIKHARLVEIDKGPHEICLSKVNYKVFMKLKNLYLKINKEVKLY